MYKSRKKNQIGEKAIKIRFCGKKQNKVYFIKIGTIQNIFMYKNYLFTPLKSKIATTSEP